jgi:hypothetical protein
MKESGVANDYIQVRCINEAKKGALTLNFEWLGMGQLKMDGFSHYRSSQLDLVGTNGVALHYLSQKRGLDILLAHPNADPSRVVVTGLSGGGWQTILIGSPAPRVTIAAPVAGYSSFARHDSDADDRTVRAVPGFMPHKRRFITPLDENAMVLTAGCDPKPAVA